MLMRYLGPHRFVYVANSKAASTAIHNSQLAGQAQVRLTTAGKHLPLSDIVNRFDFIFERYAVEDFLTFGVIRDPVEWIVSWFNFRSRPELAQQDPPASHYVGDISFQEFWDRYRGSSIYPPQSTMFCGPHGHADFLIRFGRLADDLARVGDVLGIRRLRIVTENQARVVRLRPADVPPSVSAEIRDVYRSDYELIRQLDTTNEDGLRRYAARTDELPPAAGPVVRGVARMAKGTRLEPPIRSLAARLGMTSPGAREIARPGTPER